MVAAVVLPYLAMLEKTFSGGRFMRWPTASVMRWFAWWGTSRSMSSGWKPPLASTSLMLSQKRRVACLKTREPFMWGKWRPSSIIRASMRPGRVATGYSSQRSRAWRPWLCSTEARMPRSVSVACTTTAPAPSPNSTLMSLPRVVLSRAVDWISPPRTRTARAVAARMNPSAAARA